MIYVPAYVPYLDQTVAEFVRQETGYWQTPASSGFIVGGSIPLSEIRIGETSYRLRAPLRGRFLPADDYTCEFWVDGFSPEFVGKGTRTREAYRDWRDRVHSAFQELYGKRRFEMTDEEQRRWCVLEDMIDVVGYRNETPVVVRQIGTVTQARPLPQQVTWIDGKRDTVALEDMPGEFAGYRAGQPFEADVERDPLTWRLRKVRFVQRIKPIQSMSPAQLERFWRSMPDTTTLPASSRDWTES